MATLKDIAERTGVSVATISRVLNKNPNVSDEKRELVLKAIAELGYKFPGRASRESKNGRRTIIVVTSKFGFWEDMYRGMAVAARELDYNLLIYYHPASFGTLNMTTFAEDILMLSNNITGIIMANKELEDETYFALREQLPIVFCGQYFRPKGACSISSDDESAGFELTEHLISTGKKRIAVFKQSDAYTSENFTTLQDERILGYRRALEKYGIEYDENLIHTIKNRDITDEAIDFLLDPANNIDSVLNIHGDFASAIMHKFLLRGVKVPEQIAVVGFDNDRNNGLQGITTVKQNYFAFGIESVKVLNSLLDGNIANGRKIYIDHEIVIDSSTVSTESE